MDDTSCSIQIQIPTDTNARLPSPGLRAKTRTTTPEASGLPPGATARFDPKGTSAETGAS